LINTDSEAINTSLANVILQMKSKNISIDYVQLLVDLLQWSHYDRYIQDDWAMSFWSNDSKKTESTKVYENN
jgi:CRISPR type I-E-associated protein CasB/Cse2